MTFQEFLDTPQMGVLCPTPKEGEALLYLATKAGYTDFTGAKLKVIEVPAVCYTADNVNKYLAPTGELHLLQMRWTIVPFSELEG